MSGALSGSTTSAPADAGLPRADTSIIAFGLDDWGGLPQARHHILTRLAARGWRVTFTNGPHFIWALAGAKWACAAWRSRSTPADGLQLHSPGRALLRWPRLRAWDRHIVARYTRSLVWHAQWNRARHRIAYLFHPAFAEYVEGLGDCRVVYHADDRFAGMPGWTPRLADAEARLVAAAALVVASSPGVRRHLPGAGPQRARILENGAEALRFADGAGHDAPADVAAIPRPRIGYFGAINPKVDFALVDRLAARRPDWHWVLVGNVMADQIRADPASQDAWCRLCERRNVHRLGPRPYATLPAYQAAVDVATLCYRTDPGGWWASLSPLKLHEHLAVGLPIVAAPLEVLLPLRHVVSLAQGEAAWEEALAAAIAGQGAGTPEERRRVALAHEWTTIVGCLDEWLLELLPECAQAGALGHGQESPA